MYGVSLDVLNHAPPEGPNVLATKSNLAILANDWCAPAYRFLARLRSSGGPHMHNADSSSSPTESEQK